jgi:hypothetical protein
MMMSKGRVTSGAGLGAVPDLGLFFMTVVYDYIRLPDVGKVGKVVWWGCKVEM